MPGIILFDGNCNFCSGSVQFILKRDTHKYFQFASLQGDAGKKLLIKHGISEEIDSFVVIDNDHCYIKSSAALQVCQHLKGFWRLAYVFRLIPRPLRDYVYDIVARNRYKWFGERASCLMPTPEIRERFLD
jgi:predicted DCC family thiol-disulfide oxidoreductase YuxK